MKISTLLVTGKQLLGYKLIIKLFILGPKAKQLEGEECPLHVKHPPTGEEFALGCGVCRNAHTF